MQVRINKLRDLERGLIAVYIPRLRGEILNLGHPRVPPNVN